MKTPKSEAEVASHDLLSEFVSALRSKSNDLYGDIEFASSDHQKDEFQLRSCFLGDLADVITQILPDNGNCDAAPKGSESTNC